MNYSCASIGDDDVQADLQGRRKVIVSGFEELDKTKEYCERGYYEKIYKPTILLNPFWVDLSKHILENGCSTPFLTQNFIYANKSQTEMVAVLAFLGLPLTKPNHVYSTYEGRGLQIEAAADFLIFHKGITESKKEIKPDICVAQRFFDPSNRFTESDEHPGAQIEKEVDQYVINKIYGCKVTVINCSVALQELQVLVEIPEGSIPVCSLDYTKSSTVKLSSMGNSNIETYFYFPSPGKFKVYPSNVSSKNGVVIAQALEKEFDVLSKYTNFENVTAAITQGSEEDILNFVKNPARNIWDRNVFKCQDIWWLLKNKDFFFKFIEILRERKMYDNVCWSYGLYHNDARVSKEYFKNNQSNAIANFMKYIDTNYIKVDKFSLLEYHPFVNSRVHLMASDKNQILNVQLREQYQNLIRYLTEIEKPKTEHYLAIIYYLLLKDRIDEAIVFFKKIDKADLGDYQLQYDYLAAYIDFYTGHPEFNIAREICLKYLDYPVLSWRNQFIDIANQLAEFEGTEIIEDVVADESKKKNATINVHKEEILEMAVDGTAINLTYQNIKEITILFYKIDIEVLFSRNPFMDQLKDEFVFVQPNDSHKIEIENLDLQKVKFEIPPALRSSNLYIQLRTDTKVMYANYFSTSLKLQVIENHGQIKVSNHDAKPLEKVYVKCFAKSRNGQTSFYKDGYTDLRGRFDYATLNSGDISSIEKFAILIVSDDLGSLTKEVNAPSKLGTFETKLLLTKALLQKQSNKPSNENSDKIEKKEKEIVISSKK